MGSLLILGSLVYFVVAAVYEGKTRRIIMLCLGLLLLPLARLARSHHFVVKRGKKAIMAQSIKESVPLEYNTPSSASSIMYS